MVSLRSPARRITPLAGGLRFHALIVISISTLAAGADARTWYVKPDGTGDAPTIQAAIDSTQVGDDVLLAPGTYTWTTEQAAGSMIRMKPGVWLHSQAGAQATVLDAEFRGRIIFGEDLGSEVRIQGLTIQNGRPTEPGGADVLGGGIQVIGSSMPTIVDCVVQNNQAVFGTARGGGIYCGIAVIENCQILRNRAGLGGSDGSGGGVYCGAAMIRGCLFRGNTASGDGAASAGGLRSSSAQISDCVFEGNGVGAFRFAGGGGLADAGNPQLTGCTFIENEASSSNALCRGGGAFIGTGTLSRCVFIRNRAIGRNTANSPLGGGIHSFGSSSISNCAFVGNSAAHENPEGPGFGGAIYADQSGVIRGCTLLGNSGGTSNGAGGITMLGVGGTIESVLLAYTSSGQACSGTATWSCSDLYGNSEGDAICGTDGGGNFTLDPQFCALDPVGSLNVTIQSDSPCAPGNQPEGAACGLIGAGPVGCGTVAVERTTWSRLKLLYR